MSNATTPPAGARDALAPLLSEAAALLWGCPDDDVADDCAKRLIHAAKALTGKADGGDSIYLRGLVGKLAEWQLCMSYNDSYFGEPAGMVKQVVAELARAVDPIYPPMPEPVDPLAGVTIYTATVPKATQPAAPGAGDPAWDIVAHDGKAYSPAEQDALRPTNTAATGMGDALVSRIVALHAEALERANVSSNSRSFNEAATPLESAYDWMADQLNDLRIDALAAQPAPVVDGEWISVPSDLRDLRTIHNVNDSNES